MTAAESTTGIDRAVMVGTRPRVGPLGVRVLQGAPFAGKLRQTAAVVQVVVHESVTRSAAATERVLRKRGLGVHLMVAPDGTITQHGDLGRAKLLHSANQNGPSVGLEVVNPYYPGLRDRLGLSVWRRVLRASWAHKGRYLVPTPQQAEACALLLGWLTLPPASGLHIERTWPGVVGGRLRMGRLPEGTDVRGPGIWAHHYTAHADGAWPVLYAWLRIEAGLAMDVAFERACELAEGCKDGWITLPAVPAKACA